MEELFALLGSFAPLSEAFRDCLQKMLKTAHYRKGQYVIRAGEICTNVYFVRSGLLRCFYRKNKRNVSTSFMKEGDVMVSVVSFYRQEPSKEYCKALEDSTVQYVTYDELQYLYANYPEFSTIGRKLTEQYYTKKWDLGYFLHMERARERFEYLLQQEPEIVRRVPDRYLASYLGVTHETFSRLRGEKRR